MRRICIPLNITCAIRKLIAPLKANHIAGITSDFKMDLIKVFISFGESHLL